MTLLALQRDFQQWLTQEPAELPESFVERHRNGLAVYLNNYRSQLLACLAASFPVVRTVIGEAAFDTAAARHVDAVPPHSWTLDEYANGFPEMLARTSGDAHLTELARLELALAIAFAGPDAVPLRSAQLTQVNWDTAIIRFAPTFHLLPATTNASVTWSAINAGETPPPGTPLPQAEWLAVWRSGFLAKFRRVSSQECVVIAQIRDGMTFGEVCADLVAKLGEEAGPVAAGDMLGHWLADEVIVEIV